MKNRTDTTPAPQVALAGPVQDLVAALVPLIIEEVMRQMQTEQYMSVEETAHTFNISKKAIYALISSEQIPFTPQGLGIGLGDKRIPRSLFVARMNQLALENVRG